MGIFLGIALGMHYQAVNLFIFFPAIFLVLSLSVKNRIKAFLLMIVGFLIPSFPLLYWDYHQNFANVNNILDYLLIAQYRIYVPNSWKIFIFDFIPWYWSFVVGRFYLLSLFIAFSSSIVFAFLAFKKKLKKEFVLLGILFFIFILVNRFYKGERSEGYLLYLAPFILIFTTILINYLITFKNKVIKISGFALLMVIILGNLITVKNSFLLSPVATYKNVYKELVKKFPDSKFSIYAYKYKLYDQSMALSLLMGFDGKISDDGIPLGISCYGIECPTYTKPIVESGVLVLDLRTIKKEDLDKSKQLWINVNQKNTYDDLIGWLNKNELKSTFSFKNYIMEKIGIL
jgi:hypothetical protein